MAFKAGSFTQGFAQGLNPFIEMSIKQKLMKQEDEMKAAADIAAQERKNRADLTGLSPISPQMETERQFNPMSRTPVPDMVKRVGGTAYGITPPKLSSMGIGVQTLTFDPTTGKYYNPVTGEESTSNIIPKGTVVRNKITPIDYLIGKEAALSDVKATSAAKTSTARDKAVRIQKLSELGKAVDFFETKINEIPSGEGLMGRAKGVGVAIEAFLQTDPQAAAYQSSLNGMRSQIARGLGEVGNLSEYEQKVAIGLLPKLTDNTETRNAKLKNFRDYISIRVGGTSPEPTPAQQPAGGNLSFNTEVEAEAANLPRGTRITIGGRPVEVQ